MLQPHERETASKTGEYDESIIVDNVQFKFVEGILSRRSRRLASDAPLFILAYPLWARQFHEASLVAGLAPLGPPTLYQCRHGGASHELLARQRPLDEIRKRGRWRTDASVARYEKGGRIQQQLGRLPERLLHHLRRCERRVGAILQGTWLPSAAPVVA